MIIEQYKNKHNMEEILFIDSQAVEDFLELIKNKYNQHELKDIPKNFFETGGNFFIGRLGKRVISMCGYIPIDNKTVELRRLRVIKDLRGNGYGGKMLKYVEKDIVLKGYSKIVFSTASVRESTLNFYKKYLYTKTGKSKYDQLTIIKFEKYL